MKFSNAIAVSALVACNQVAGHSLITLIKGANGVNMPGLTVVDGTPRGCASLQCKAQGDTAIIREAEVGGQASALGRTATGPVDPERVMKIFMSGGSSQKKRRDHPRDFLKSRQLLGGLGAGLNNAASMITGPAGVVLNGAQDLAQGVGLGGVVDAVQGAANGLGSMMPGMAKGSITAAGVKEKYLSEYAGKGAETGLPKPASDGTITMVYHQVNQDGAGPFEASIDPSSGGKDPKAFQKAEVVTNVPGAAGFSVASNTDFDIKVKVPAGMKCTGEVAGVKNVCICRIRNTAISGPFGGSAAFTN